MTDGSKIKMIGLDLDGTALDHNKDFTPRLRKAFRDAADKGIHIVIATGRAVCSLPDAIFDVPEIRYVISSNGARIIDIVDDKTIFENNISEKCVRNVHDVLHSSKANVEIFTNGRAYISLHEYNGIISGEITTRDEAYVLSTRTPVENIFSFMIENREHIENISVNYPNTEFKQGVEQKLRQIDGITLTSSFLLNNEIGGKTTSKASALTFLMEKFGIEKDELIVCGDSLNDAAMIRLAGIGVAMGNAEEYIKEIADYVTDTNYDDGVAKAIEKLAL